MRVLQEAGFKLLFAIVLLTLTATFSQADVVTMENGDRYTGRIMSVIDGVLELDSEYAGVVKLPASAVAELSSDSVHELHLANGEVVKGSLTTVGKNKVQVADSGDRSETLISLDQIQSINPPVAEPVRWQGDITLGGTMTSGNTEGRDTNLAISGLRRGARDRITLQLRYNYGEEDEQRTVENTYGTIKYDYFVSERFYTLLSLEFLSDTFKDLNLRTVIGPGIGYQVYEDEDKSLAFEVGVSWFNEDRESVEDESWLAARVGVNLRYRLLQNLLFTDGLLVYPSLEEGGEYQLRNEAALVSALGAAWSLMFTNIYEHDSQPAAGVTREDLTWILGLQYAL